jgi:ATP-binding cassette subfamily B protein
MNFIRRLLTKRVGGAPSQSPGLKERMAALRYLPAFFRLVWKTSPPLTLLNIVLRIGRSAIPLSMLYVGKQIIDQVVQLNRGGAIHHYGNLWKWVALEFALAVLSDGLSRLTNLLDGLLGDLFANHTSVEIMLHASTLDLDQFEDSAFYDKLERARQQTLGRTILLSQLLSQVQDLISMGFLAAGLLLFNPWLILLLLIAVVPAFLGESHFNDQTYALTRGQTPQRRQLDYIRYVGASDETAKEMKLFDLSRLFIDKFREISTRFYFDNRRLSIRRSAWGTVFAVLGSIGYYAAYVTIILQTVEGKISLGALTFLAGSFRQLRSLLEGILSRFSSLSQGSIYLRDFFEFFEIRPRIRQPSHPHPFPNPIRQGFRFEDAGFRYEQAENWAIRHLHFNLAAGEKLALVGENGAGKTTLVKLMARLYDPSEGRILLDGIDLKEYDIGDLRRNIGIIFQDFIRYQMSFAQNIGVGNAQAIDDRDRIVASARKSLADTLAARFSAGYEQMLGRRFNQGIELSGGEWQKVALARAYMRDAQLLILDEPTAALDARAEYEVFQRFAELTRGKSAVLISHRFSTVRMADRILVLEKGEMIEWGTHEELLRAEGRYAELFHLQALGYR